MTYKEKPPQFSMDPRNVASGICNHFLTLKNKEFYDSWKIRDDARRQIDFLQKAGITNNGILFELTTPSKRMRRNTYRETVIIGHRATVIAELICNNDPLVKDIDNPTLRKALCYAIINDIASIRMVATNSLIDGRSVDLYNYNSDIRVLEQFYEKLTSTVDQSDPSLKGV